MTEQHNIIQGLDRIAQWAKMHPEQDAELVPGISSVEIEKILKGFPFKIPTELRQLYEHGYTSMCSGPNLSRFWEIKKVLAIMKSFGLLIAFPKMNLMNQV
jgi:cell wall assembly regulator SMI1